MKTPIRSVMDCASESGVAPGLGFVHLSAASAKAGSAGARGTPRGESAETSGACCALCKARDSCAAWLHRGDKCFLGKCHAELPCFERLRTNLQPPSQATAGVSSRAGEVPPARLCGRPSPMLAPIDGRRSAAMAAAATHGATSASRGLALVLLGHRAPLMFDTVPDRVIAPLVADGTPVDFFALLENSTMARAFRGRRPLGTPALAELSDEELKQHLASAVHGAGGNVATLRIGPRPLVTLPDFPWRLSRCAQPLERPRVRAARPPARPRARILSADPGARRYTEAVKMTVAARFAKEGLGWQIVEAYEQTRGAKCARDLPIALGSGPIAWLS